MGPEVAFHVESAGPFFHKLLNRLALQRFLSFSAGKQIVFVGGLDLIYIFVIIALDLSHFDDTITHDYKLFETNCSEC